MRRGAPATGVLCYRQVHRANHALDAAFQDARGTQVPSYLGHAEAWVDFRRSTIFFGNEHTITDRR